MASSLMNESFPLEIMSDDESELGANEETTTARSSIGMQNSKGSSLQSPIRNYFIFDPAQYKSICQVTNCDHSNFGKNSSTLVNHLKKHKPEFALYEPLKRKFDHSKTSKDLSAKYSRLENFGFQSRKPKQTNKWELADKRQKELEEKLAALFGATRLSHNFITNGFFRDFVECAQPYFNIPRSRNKIRSLIYALQEKTMKELQRHIDSAKQIAVLLDMWTQASFKFGYLGVTVSFMSYISNTVLVVLIGVRQLNHPHTAERIRSCADHALTEYKISAERISRYLTDGGANMRKAYKYDALIFEADIQSDGEEEESDECLPHPGDPNLDLSFDDESITKEIDEFDEMDSEFSSVFPARIDCYAHKLMRSLANVVDRDPGTRNLRKNIFNMVRKFKSKSTAVQALDSLKSKSVLQPARTRWNSFSIVIDRLLEIKSQFLTVCLQENIDTIDEADWSVMRSLAHLLNPFKRHTDLLQGDKYTTIDYVFPSLLQLQMNLEKQVFPGLGELPQHLHADIATRFAKILNPNVQDFDATFLLATSLSPSLALILDDDLLELAQMELKKIVKKELMASMAQITESTGGEELVQSHSEISADSLFSDLLQKADAKRRAARSQIGMTARRQAEILVSAYFDELPTIKKCDPVSYWQTNLIKYGKLSDIAIGLLTIPASTATVERVFSITDDVADPKRNRIKPKMLEIETMLRFNKMFI